MFDYADLLALVRSRPGTTQALSKLFNMTEDRLRLVLTFMCARGLVFERAFRPCRGGVTPVWSVIGPSAPYPFERERSKVAAAATRKDLATFCQIVHELRRIGTSAIELADATGCGLSRARALLRYMGSQGLRLVYIEQWSKRLAPGGPPTPHYRWGRLPDAPRPAAQTPQENWTKHHNVKRQRNQHAQLLFMTAGKPYRRSTTNEERTP